MYAEDPARDFVPSPGLVTEASWPAGVRVDTWVRAGTEVPPFYDPLLAKIVVHGATRAEAVDALHDALARTTVRGIETNRRAAARRSSTRPSSAPAPSPRRRSSATAYARRAVDVLVAGTTTVQDLPGRVGLWHVGVPPSGPMDDRSFALGNRILGNPDGAPGLECTAVGPTLRFAADAVVCLTGADDGARRSTATPVELCDARSRCAPARRSRSGARSGPGLRAYVLVRGGFDVGDGARLGVDVHPRRLRRPRRPRAAHRRRAAPRTRRPRRSPLAGPAIEPSRCPSSPPTWELAVVDGPHAAPDFVTEAGIAAFYATEWQVHHHSSRTGVRLVGPPIEWARADGGEAGLHPSNVHDTPYTVGAVDFTGDMPILLGPDGPSLGGFTCPVTVITADRWKLGQLAPGDRVRFVPVDRDEARGRRRRPPGPASVTSRADRDDPAPTVLGHPTRARRHARR